MVLKSKNQGSKKKRVFEGLDEYDTITSIIYESDPDKLTKYFLMPL